MAPGDVVHVANGVYHEAVASDVSGTAAARIRFVSDSRFGAHLDAASALWEHHDLDRDEALGRFRMLVFEIEDLTAKSGQ